MTATPESGPDADPDVDPFLLDRFVTAQAGGVRERALGELGEGAKRTHWMWFVFPQIAGLGRSAMAERYAISGLAEARAYLRHPVLGERLRDAARVALEAPAASAEALLGGIDAMKLRSSMTLFDLIEPEGVFASVLERWFDGERDARTIELAGRAG